MQTVRAVIVDDEPLAQDGLRILLEREKSMQVDGICSNGREAVAAIRELQPDVVFLDIEMPRMNGFDVIREIGAEQMPLVIFVTAYDQYAVDAFNFHAMDYLLKPVVGDELQEAVEKSIRNNNRFSRWCFSFQRGCTGTNNADQAFKLQAKDAITI